ncbi:acyltransferase [Cryobacterium sp. TmT2-59]|uniref:acyltransferase family protein n=1 Tax=Cryobacterium sp. TmT2-59 TaxID=1259264 RepID=UPI00106AEBD2|nr:acyltransferase [Cryobacterium sp. TmT2-59]TFC87658.1 acyltransferase [Cryobacterium sp. TmT2-59]
MKAEIQELGRLTSLDGLRGVAAVIVLLHHSLLLVPALAAPYYTNQAVGAQWSFAWWMVHTPFHLLWEGKGAVFIFFVLSGIVLTLPVLRSDRFSWIAFYPQRLARLYVPIWAAVIFTVLTFVVVPRVGYVASDWLRERPTDVTLGAFARDMTLVLGNGGLASPLWSLRWEILFSLAIPLYVYTARIWPGLNPFKALICVGLITVGGAVENAFLLYVPMFMLGSLIAVELPRLRDTGHGMDLLTRARMAWGGLLALGLLLMTTHWIGLGMGLPTRAVGATSGLVVIGACIVVFVAMLWHPVKRVLGTRPVQWLGLISFSLYLVHEPIVVAFGYLFGSAGVLLAIPCAILVAVLVASAFYHLVERPSHVLAKRIRTKMSVTSAPRSDLLPVGLKSSASAINVHPKGAEVEGL